MGQSKVAKVEEFGDQKKPIHCLHAQVLEGATNPVRADSRFIYYNGDKLKKASQLFDGVQLNWYLPRTMGGFGMKLPHGVEFIDQRGYYQSRYLDQSGNKVKFPGKKGVVYKVITDKQRVLAHGLRKAWYQDNLTKPPFKPIGMEEDMDAKRWGNDIKKHTFYRAQLASCPMMPDAEEIPTEVHPANWCPSTVDHQNTVWTYIFRGLNYRRFRQTVTVDELPQVADNVRIEIAGNGKKRSYYRLIEMDNPHLYDEVRLYKLRKARTNFRDCAREFDPVVVEDNEELRQFTIDDFIKLAELDSPVHGRCDLCMHSPCQCHQIGC
jgi:hypothetical protein